MHKQLTTVTQKHLLFFFTSIKMGRETQNIPEYPLFKTPAIEEQRFGLWL